MIDNTLFSCSGSANLCISSFLQDHASLRVVSAMDSQKSILSIVAWKVTLATAVGMSNSSINQVLVLLPRLEALPEHKICNKVRVPKAFVKSHKWYWVDDPSDSMLAMEGKQVTLIVDSSGRMENIVFRPGTPVKGEFKMTPSLRPVRTRTRISLADVSSLGRPLEKAKSPVAISVSSSYRMEARFKSNLPMARVLLGLPQIPCA